PFPTRRSSDLEEEAEGADDQQPGQQHEVLGPEGGAEDVELPFRQVPPDGLPAIPVQPDRAKEEDEEKCAAEATDIAEHAGERPGVDFLALGVEVDVFTF